MIEFWKSKVWLVEILYETKEFEVFPEKKMLNQKKSSSFSFT